ncbi:GCN5 family acetyltransferase [Alkalihalobacillus alcalophilus ATCC 27647 = CGMCC 1.3604]|uniref:GCN5 family acetyltransferase n=1 Tax=Alkalihalobacillus alcalophilus ATCC 27647 = CGMCC 1.3604 TaxID=1218173 RepID=A0A094YRC2_ALKAL|nr:GNAT family N-acetyltransferase [Alkalihalobacillus alcalophilus]KGA96032.1 GCN5 family acetyltransferase [Alkalihalobacillus alcalophilus ATCC 27647 = CGMCC 1.3604]MED1564014.1 GNAT family N-acetyltransferase [Alkalihalobacillus alcalophilus]THG90026.1 GCN5 family acetyltransferase [Alkalihalobacillus alcalophilus ATCC 27647 = CGMCC 1.3604]
MYETRQATELELEQISEFWYKMTCEMSEIDQIPIPNQERVQKVKELFEDRALKGELMFRVAVNSEGHLVACAGGLLREEYLYPLAAEQTLIGWVVSVYTEQGYRKQGLARLLVDEVNTWLKEKGCGRVRLWSSTAAKPLYNDLGFSQMPIMTKSLIDD